MLADGKHIWKMRVVPLGEGQVDFAARFSLLKTAGFDGPVSFHCEYAELSVESLIDQARLDVRYISGMRFRV